MAESKNTIEKFLDGFNGKELDNFDAKKSIYIIKEIASHIPQNGEYDQAIIGNRIGEYIHGIQECGKILASLGLVEAYQETEVDKEEAIAALQRAPEKGYTTAGEKKLYAKMDDQYIKSKNKLNEIQAVIAYIENYRTSLDKAHLHLKKIIDHNKVEERFGNEHERFGGNGVVDMSNNNNWIKEEALK